MMDMFIEAQTILPPFKYYLKHMREEKTQKHVKNRSTNKKGIPYKLLIDELFDPQDNASKDSAICIAGIANEMCVAFLKEFHNPQKLSHDHLSSQNGDLSCSSAATTDKNSAKHTSVVNDPFESTLGVHVDEIERNKNIKLTRARGMNACRKNFASGLKKTEKDSKLFYFTNYYYSLF